MEQPAQQAEQPSSARSPALKTLRFLKDHRDGFLVVGALVYALGFVTWAIHSWRTDIGFIDVLDAQYIVAGLVPGILISCTFYYIALARPHTTWGAKFRGIAVFLCFIFAVTHVINAFIEVVSDSATARDPGLFYFSMQLIGEPVSAELGRRVAGFSRMLLYVIYLILSVNILHWLRSSAQGAELGRISVPEAIAWAVVLLFLFLSMKAYMLKVFPSLPPEMAGGQARCARLDVQLDKLSQETAGNLIEQAKVPATAESALLVGNEIRPDARATEKKMKSHSKKDEKAKETVTTREIYVVYISDKSLFFSLDKSIEGARKYEVSRDAISLISWCVSSDPA